MPAKHKVSVVWQIVFTFIGILNLWAYYRIRKLRKYILYIILPEIIITGVLVFYVLDGLWVDTDVNPSIAASEAIANRLQHSPLLLATQVTSWALHGLSIYLVIIWSRQHNKQFDQPTKQLE